MFDHVFTERYMVTPLMDLDLNNIIKIQKLTDDQVKFIIYQIMRGLKYIHSAGIIHRYEVSKFGNYQLEFSTPEI